MSNAAMQCTGQTIMTVAGYVFRPRAEMALTTDLTSNRNMTIFTVLNSRPTQNFRNEDCC